MRENCRRGGGVESARLDGQIISFVGMMPVQARCQYASVPPLYLRRLQTRIWDLLCDLAEPVFKTPFAESRGIAGN